MKATGEIMGIGSNLSECLLKSVRSLENGAYHFNHPKFDGMKKEELFTSVMDTGVFCKKSFSIGEAVEKRYYLECRTIQNT